MYVRSKNGYCSLKKKKTKNVIRLTRSAYEYKPNNSSRKISMANTRLHQTQPQPAHFSRHSPTRESTVKKAQSTPHRRLSSRESRKKKKKKKPGRPREISRETGHTLPHCTRTITPYVLYHTICSTVPRHTIYIQYCTITISCRITPAAAPRTMGKRCPKYPLSSLNQLPTHPHPAK